jgi:hypothetical protein
LAAQVGASGQRKRERERVLAPVCGNVCTVF